MPWWVRTTNIEMFLETELSWVFIFTRVMINVSRSSVGVWFALLSWDIFNFRCSITKTMSRWSPYKLRMEHSEVDPAIWKRLLKIKEMTHSTRCPEQCLWSSGGPGPHCRDCRWEPPSQGWWPMETLYCKLTDKVQIKESNDSWRENVNEMISREITSNI